MDRWIEFIEQAGCVPVGDFEAARTLMYQLQQEGRPMSEAAYIASVIAEASGIDKAVMMSMYKEASHHHPVHGLMQTVASVSKVVINELKESAATFVRCGSCYYVWWNENSHETGVLTCLSEDDLTHLLRSSFPDVPVIANRGQLKAVIEWITLEATNHNFFDDRPAGLCVENGWLEFNTANLDLVLKPHGPENKATFRLETPFDPDAEATTLGEGLRRLLPEASLKALQEFVGCILFGIRLDGDNARNCLMLYGPPNSGKSSITEIIAAMLPPEAIASLPAEKWSKTEAVSALLGKSLNIVTESGQKAKIRSADFKTVVSGERLTGRYRYGNEFSFRPTAKHILATNTIPKFDIADESVCRRILAIQFDRSLTRDQIDPDFVTKVHAEMSGFINWCAEGARRAMERGHYALPPCHNTVTELIRFGDDLIGAFVSRMIEVTGAETDAVSTGELREALRRFAENRNIDTSGWTVNTHTRTLAAMLQEKCRARRVQRDGVPHYLRIRLRSTEAPT